MYSTENKRMHISVNLVWPSDAMWRVRTGSTLSQVMACCLTVPSHYLNQCSLVISDDLWHSHEGNFTGNAQDVYPWYKFQGYQFKITTASPGRHRVNRLYMGNAQHEGFVKWKIWFRPLSNQNGDSWWPANDMHQDICIVYDDVERLLFVKNALVRWFVALYLLETVTFSSYR